jgi:hypothetical protein
MSGNPERHSRSPNLRARSQSQGDPTPRTGTFCCVSGGIGGIIDDRAVSNHNLGASLSNLAVDFATPRCRQCAASRRQHGDKASAEHAVCAGDKHVQWQGLGYRSGPLRAISCLGRVLVG